jgi:hypothetical protein
MIVDTIDRARRLNRTRSMVSALDRSRGSQGSLVSVGYPLGEVGPAGVPRHKP